MIYEHLGQGRENAKTIEELRIALGVSDSREVRKMIAEERRNGALIISIPSVEGYWMPEDGDLGSVDIRQYLRSMYNRIAALASIVSAGEKSFAAWNRNKQGGA